jgi:hypothetical protein
MPDSGDVVVDDVGEAPPHQKHDVRQNPAVASFSVDSAKSNGQPQGWRARLLACIPNELNDFHEPWSQDEKIVRKYNALKNLGKVFTLL